MSLLASAWSGYQLVSSSLEKHHTRIAEIELMIGVGGASSLSFAVKSELLRSKYHARACPVTEYSLDSKLGNTSKYFEVTGVVNDRGILSECLKYPFRKHQTLLKFYSHVPIFSLIPSV